MDKSEKLNSPCDGNCIIDPETKLCRGCFRTMDEIMRWPLMPEPDKLLVLAKVEERRGYFFK